MPELTQCKPTVCQSIVTAQANLHKERWTKAAVHY